MPDKCVISVTAGGVEPRYPNFKDIMAAKSKPIEQVSLGDLNISSNQNLEFIDIENVENSKSGEKIIYPGCCQGFSSPTFAKISAPALRIFLVRSRAPETKI